jgi:hypothetical protein
MAATNGGSTIAAAGSVTTTTKLISGVTIGKWIAGVALSGALVTGGIALVRSAREQPHVSVLPAKREHVRARSDGAPHLTTPVAAQSAPVAPAPPRAAAALPASSDAPSRAPVVRPQPDISAEIATVDTVRNVLRARQPQAALLALDRYDARFGRSGALREEAAALRIEALLESGKRERAKALARMFLAHHALSPYAARVRALVAGSSH